MGYTASLDNFALASHCRNLLSQGTWKISESSESSATAPLRSETIQRSRSRCDPDHHDTLGLPSLTAWKSSGHAVSCFRKCRNAKEKQVPACVSPQMLGICCSTRRWE